MPLSRIVNARDPHAPQASRGARRLWRVSEWRPAYEDEGSQRSAHGAVAAEAGAWWSVSLEAPMRAASSHAALVRVRLRRHGPPVSPLVDGAVELHVPLAELDAVLVALQGVVAQARHDGVV